jgi:hypothetical protein
MYPIKPIVLSAAVLFLAGCFGEQSNLAESEKMTAANFTGSSQLESVPENISHREISSPNADLKSVEGSMLPLRGKPGAQVTLATTEEYILQSEIVTDIELMLVTIPTQGRMQVAVSTSDGLELLSPNSFEFTLDIETGEYRLPLQLRAKSNGRYYVHLQIDIESGNRTTARAVSAIVQVGPKADVRHSTTAASRKKQSDEPAVISLPVTETIIRE